MVLFALVIFLIVFLRLNLDDNKVGKPEYALETQYLKVICGILILLAGLRSSTVGTDTASYIYDYIRDAKLPLKHVLERHYYIGAGYYFFMRIFHYTGLSVHWWFCAVAWLYIYSMYSFIKKYSQDKLVSILCFFTIGLYTFSLAGLKQTMAMGFAALAYICLDDKHYVRAILLGLVAYWCHSATIIFMFGVVLYFLRNKRYYYPVLAAFFALILLVGEKLWMTLILLLNDDHYTELYAEADNIYSAWTFVFFLLLLAIMVIPWKKYSNEAPVEARLLYGMTVLAISFQSLATSFSSAFRVAYYFLPFMCVLIPNCCNYCSSNSPKRSMKMVLCVICISWMLYTCRESVYLFFWQD